MAASKEKNSLQQIEIAKYFLGLGLFCFGGPLSILSALQKDLVDRRAWMSKEKFLQALSLLKTLPGPVSSQLAIFLGRERGGTFGGIIAGFLLIAPAFVMMILLGHFHNAMEKIPSINIFLLGIQACSLGIIADGVWRLTANYRREKLFWILALIAFFLTKYSPTMEPLVILGFGFFGILTNKKAIRLLILVTLTFFIFYEHKLDLIPNHLISDFIARQSSTLQMLYVFIKAGAFTFGTGLAIIPMLSADVVDTFHWLTQKQFLDAIAFGQLTPGPIFITATFIGFKVSGLWGAIVATVSVFAFSFINMLTWFPKALARFSARPGIQKFLFWAIAAVTGALAFSLSSLARVPTQLNYNSSQSAMFYSLTLMSLILALKTKLPVWIIIPVGGILSLGVSYF